MINPTALGPALARRASGPEIDHRLASAIGCADTDNRPARQLDSLHKALSRDALGNAPGPLSVALDQIAAERAS